MVYTSKILIAFSAALQLVHGCAKGNLSPVGSTTRRVRASVLPDALRSDPFLMELLAAHAAAAENDDRRSAPLPPIATTLSFDTLRPLGLTRRECEVLVEIGRGRTDAEIAVALGCATKTVGKHVEHVLVKLGAETRLAAVHTARKWLLRQP